MTTPKTFTPVSWTDDSCREHLYQGQRLASSILPEVLTLIEMIKANVATIFECVPGSLPAAHESRTDEQFFEVLQRARAELSQALDGSIHEVLSEFVCALGWNPNQWKYDTIRLRAVTPTSHTVTAAQAAFTTHRDTWYANPACQVNVWMPLFDVQASQSFGFHPEWFERPIENTSSAFDYQSFLDAIGFQGGAASSDVVFPAPIDAPPIDAAERFALSAGQALLFSAAHLHRTMPNTSDATRWSLDCRLVHIRDRDLRLGASNVDDASTGDASLSYRAFSR